MNLRSLFPSKWAIAAGLGCAILIPSTIGLSYGYGVTHRDKVRIEKELVEEKVKYETADRSLVGCTAQLKGLTASVTLQNERIAALVDEAARVRREAEARLQVEKARTRRAEAERQTLLREQMQLGETPCDAAWRLHRENLQ